MRIALGMIVKDESFFLKRHLPLLSQHFKDIIAVDALSEDDTVETLVANGARVFERAWDDNFGAARKFCIEKAKEFDFDWIFMLDADECMFPEAMIEAIKFMESNVADVLYFPRIEFFGDNKHYNPKIFPDLQGRAIKIDSGYSWSGRVHETIAKEGWPIKDVVVVPNAPIFHYGWAFEPEKRWLRYSPATPIPDFMSHPDLKEYGGQQPC